MAKKQKQHPRKFKIEQVSDTGFQLFGFSYKLKTWQAQQLLTEDEANQLQATLAPNPNVTLLYEPKRRSQTD